jgi:hypothetical protein
LIIPNAFAAMDKDLKSKVVEIRYENGTSQILNLDKNKNPEILNPEGYDDQYFLLRAGVKSFSTTSKRSITYFDKNKENTCQLENSYDPDFKLGNSDFYINEKTRIFRTCLKLKLVDPAGGLIEFSPTQTNCSVNKINDSTMLLTGGDCFIKVKSKQALQVTLDPNPECLNRQFLAEQKISPIEIVTSLQAFVYPKKEIGQVFRETALLWEKKVYININSGKDLLESVAKEDSENNTFQRPAHLVYPDLMITDLKVMNQTAGATGYIDFGFLLSGFGGQDKCIEGLCSNYQNYDYPITPMAVISVINERNGRKEELAAKFFGGRIPAKWNGEFRATTFFRTFDFEKDKKYVIDFVFSDPADDFQGFAKTFKSKLNLGIKDFSNMVVGRDGFLGFSSAVPQLSSINGVGSLDPTELFKGIPSGMLDDLPRIFEALEDETFPPEYSHVCNKSGVCREARKGNHLIYSIKFKVKEVNGSKVDIGDSLTVERKSPLFPSYEIEVKTKPTIKCSSKN